MEIKSALIGGCGQMGPGIAYTLARVGCESKLFGRTTKSVERGLAAFNKLLDQLASEKLIDSGEATAAQALVSGTTELESAAAGADLVVESIPENLQLKQDFFGRVEKYCGTETILASNTSGLPATEIGSLLEHPERFAVTHFWNPPHLMPLVEVVKGENTSMGTVEALVELFRRAGKKPVLVLKDTPGQLGNRLFQALLREAIHIVEEGIASVEDVDTAVKNGLGRRFPAYGPLEHNDVVGLDTLYAIQSYICSSLDSSSEPAELLKEKFAAGNLGVKSGNGFYDWQTRSSKDLIDERDRFLLQLMKLEQHV